MLSLLLHPSLPVPRYRVVAEAVRLSHARLQLRYRLDEDVAAVRLPAPAAIGRGSRLWQHTCFEAFVGIAGDTSYQEFNFSPSAAWDAYSFASYRDGAPMGTDTPPPEIQVRGDTTALTVETCISINLDRHAVWRVALSAVIEHTDGRLTYWALHHPPGQPDFHHPSAFVLQLDPPS